MKTFKSIILLLAVSLVIPTFCACGDDEDAIDDIIPDKVVIDKTVKVNGINVIGMWVELKPEYDPDDLEYADELYEVKSDGTAIAYTGDGSALINGIMQCARSDFGEVGRATWTHKDKNLIVGGLIITITKKISNDEAEANWFGEKVIFKRVKGFAKK